MWTAGFPEPKTFSTRVARLLRSAAGDFDVVHDNQVLGYGILDIEAARAAGGRRPSTTRSRSTAGSTSRPRRPGASGCRCAGGTASCGCRPGSPGGLRRVLTPSESSRRDIVTRLRRRPATDPVVPLGRGRRVQAADRAAGAGPDRGHGQRRRPDQGRRDAARGLRQAAHRARRRAACWSAGPSRGGRTEQLIDELGDPRPRALRHGISDAELVDVMGSAEIACVPSLYEGFSLPTAELMACETPLVVGRAGAIPEVVGPGRPVRRPGRAGRRRRARAALAARCSTTPSDVRGWARPGGRGSLELFSWRAVAAATAAAYEDVDRRLDGRRGRPARADR